MIGAKIAVPNLLPWLGGIREKYLDQIAGLPTAAYSVDKVVSTYTDAVVRVRRASDNEEADVAFDNDTITLDSTVDNFSTGSLSATLGEFVGNSSYSDPDGLVSPQDAFVATWYDQAGNNDATQITAGSQPQIVNAGALVTENGKVALDFDGVNDYLQNTSIVANQPATHFLTAKANQVGVLQRFFDGGVSNSTRHSIFQNVNRFQYFAGIVFTGVSDDTNQNLHYFIANGTSSEIAINGATASIGSGGTDNLNGITLAARWDGGANFGDVMIQELIIYNSDKSALRTAIEGNINGRFSIYT